MTQAKQKLYDYLKPHMDTSVDDDVYDSMWHPSDFILDSIESIWQYLYKSPELTEYAFDYVDANWLDSFVGLLNPEMKQDVEFIKGLIPLMYDVEVEIEGTKNTLDYLFSDIGPDTTLKYKWEPFLNIESYSGEWDLFFYQKRKEVKICLFGRDEMTADITCTFQQFEEFIELIEVKILRELKQ